MMKLKTLTNIGRVREIVSVFVKYGFADVANLLELPGRGVAERLLDIDPSKTPYERFRMALDELGPTFVKFGQIMSLRADLLPKPLVQELRKLQDEASAVDEESIREVIRSNLSAPWGDVFLFFDASPVAAASLSQVHRAVVREGPTEVALKVQRPDIVSKVDRDLSILESIAGQLHERVAEMQVYDLPGLVQLIRRTLQNELDFLREARYAQIARSHLGGLEGIHVPRVLMALSTPQLLVMEYVHGLNARHLDRSLLKDPAAMARNGLRATVRQLLEVGFFHADPHPGNLIVSEGDTLNLLDWGMVGRLTPEDRQEMVELIGAIVDKDSRQLVDTLLTITGGGADIDRRALERDVLEKLDAHMVAAVSELRLGQVVLEIAEMIRRYQLRVPTDLLLMVKALVTAEGTVQLLDPEMNIVEEMRPHLGRLAARRFSPEFLWRGISGFLFRLAASPARFPRRIGAIVEKMEKGKLRIGFEQLNLGGLQHTLEKTFSRLTMGIILAAMIIGSSLIITTGVPPVFHGYPLLGLAGYLISGVLGLWLIFDILRNR